MAFDDVIAELRLLFTQMQNQPEDAHELYEVLHEKLNEIRATGMPLPNDLAEMEGRLREELITGTTKTGRRD